MDAETRRNPNLLDTRSAAAYIGVSERTLAKLKAPEGPISYYVVGGRNHYYHVRDLDQYLETKKVNPIEKKGGNHGEHVR